MDNILQDEVYYESSSPWPPLSNGEGYTLELIDPSYDNSLPSSWSNINYHGSPDAINSLQNSLKSLRMVDYALNIIVDFYKNILMKIVITSNFSVFLNS